MVSVVTDKKLFLNNERKGSYVVLNFRDGRSSTFPAEGLFRNYLGGQPDFGHLYLGIQSGLGYGTQIKFDNDIQKLIIGNYFSGGWKARFVLNSMHNIDTPSSCILQTVPGMVSKPVENLGHIIIEHDVWFGDEVFVMGGVRINTGCVVGARSVIPPRKELEAYGVYVGNPARLVKFRFSEEIIELLLELKWWHKPLSWLQRNSEFMAMDLTSDEGASKELLTELIRQQD